MVTNDVVVWQHFCTFEVKITTTTTPTNIGNKPPRMIMKTSSNIPIVNNKTDINL